MLNRDIRQRDLIPPEKLAATEATVIGVGAIGKQVAIQLATIGVHKITLIDHDVVGEENLAAQGFREKDIGRSKVDAVKDICEQLNQSIRTDTHAAKFNGLMLQSGTCFCCVDKIQTRKNIFSTIKNKFDLFIDGRMSAEYLRVITAFDEKSSRYYPSTIFKQSEAYAAPCTSKTTIYCANIAAGFMVSQFVKWLRGCDIYHDFDVNILTNEIEINNYKS